LHKNIQKTKTNAITSPRHHSEMCGISLLISYDDNYYDKIIT